MVTNQKTRDNTEYGATSVLSANSNTNNATLCRPHTAHRYTGDHGGRRSEVEISDQLWWSATGQYRPCCRSSHPDDGEGGRSPLSIRCDDIEALRQHLETRGTPTHTITWKHVVHPPTPSPGNTWYTHHHHHLETRGTPTHTITCVLQSVSNWQA